MVNTIRLEHTITIAIALRVRCLRCRVTEWMHCESCLQVTNRDKLYVDDCYVCRAIVQVDRDQKGIVLIR